MCIFSDSFFFTQACLNYVNFAPAFLTDDGQLAGEIWVAPPFFILLGGWGNAGKADCLVFSAVSEGTPPLMQRWVSAISFVAGVDIFNHVQESSPHSQFIKKFLCLSLAFPHVCRALVSTDLHLRRADTTFAVLPLLPWAHCLHPPPPPPWLSCPTMVVRV